MLHSETRIEGGFQDPVVDVVHFQLTYTTLETLWRDQRFNGHVCLLPERRKSLGGRRRFQSFCESLQASPGPDSALTITYEVIFGQAFSPASTIW